MSAEDVCGPQRSYGVDTLSDGTSVSQNSCTIDAASNDISVFSEFPSVDVFTVERDDEFLFSSLSPEVRNKIYMIAVKADHSIKIDRDSAAYSSRRPLEIAIPFDIMLAKAPIKVIFQLNHKTRNEAIAIFYESNSFQTNGKCGLLRFINFLGSAGFHHLRSLRIGISLKKSAKPKSDLNDAMIAHLYNIIFTDDKNLVLPSRHDLNPSIASLAEFKQLQSLTIEHLPSASGGLPYFTEMESDFLHVLCLLKQYKQTGKLRIGMSSGFADQRIGGAPNQILEGITLTISARQTSEQERLRGLVDGVLRVLRGAGHDAHLEGGFPQANSRPWWRAGGQ